MSITLKNLSTAFENVIENINSLPGNLFLENKQEDFLTTLVTIELTKQLSNTSTKNFCITQYTGNGIQRADIAEINMDSGDLISHIECKYLYSDDFKKPKRAKINWAEASIFSDLCKLNVAPKNYIVIYCIHILNMEEILKNIDICKCLQYNQNIFTYIHNKRLNESLMSSKFKRTYQKIFNSNEQIDELINDEVKKIIQTFTEQGSINTTKKSCKLQANIPCCDNSVTYKLIFCAVEIT